jgi:trigger factor
MSEIDAATVGMKAGDEREVALRFPDDHRLESLRGKGGAATLKVSEVKEKILPARDDDFAKSVGEFETLEALRAEVRKQLDARREAEGKRELDDKVAGVVLARHEFTVPDAMVMRQIAHQVEHARERMRRQGVDPEAVQWDVPKLVGELRPAAEQGVRRALLLEAIADKEGLVPADAEVDAEVEKIARASQRPAPAVRRMMEKSGDLEALRAGLRERKTLDFLIEHATVRT